MQFWTGVLAYVRRNHLALLALFVALGGTAAWAADGPLAGQNTVGSDDIIGNEVKSDDIGNGRIFNLDIADETIQSAKILNATLTGSDVASNTLTGSDIDEGTLDGIEFDSMEAVPHARAFGDPQVFQDGIVTTVDFTSASTEFDVLFDPPTDVFTIETSGIYLITAQLPWVANTVGYRKIHVSIDGLLYAEDTRLAGPSRVSQSLSTMAELSAGDDITMHAQQTSNGDLGSVSNAGRPSLSIAWVGPPAP